MQLHEAWAILVRFLSCVIELFLTSVIGEDWEENSSETNDRQMASVMNGEDWDREAHTGHIFNDEEIRQLNG